MNLLQRRKPQESSPPKRMGALLLCGLLLASAAASSVHAQNWRSPSGWPADSDMLSNELFPLSAYFGVCKIGPGVLSARFGNGMRGHFSTTAEIADETVLTVAIGKFSFVSGTTFNELPAAQGRRLQLMHEGKEESLLVTGLQRSSDTMVIIRYEQNNRSAYRAALRLANRLVACGLSRRS